MPRPRKPKNAPTPLSDAAVPDVLLTPSDTATILGTTVSTLADWRHDHIGVAWVKSGHSVRYKLEDVRAWIASHRIDPAAGM